MRQNRKQGWGRSLFNKTFYNENKEKKFYQAMLSNCELALSSDFQNDASNFQG